MILKHLENVKKKSGIQQSRKIKHYIKIRVIGWMEYNDV